MNWHEKIKELIKAEWNNLWENHTESPAIRNKKVDNLTIKINGNNVYYAA